LTQAILFVQDIMQTTTCTKLYTTANSSSRTTNNMGQIPLQGHMRDTFTGALLSENPLQYKCTVK